MAVEQQAEEPAAPRAGREDGALRTQLAALLSRVSEVVDVNSDSLAGSTPDALDCERLCGQLDRAVQELIRLLAGERRRAAEFREELEERLSTIELQNAALRELAMPFIEVGHGVLCVPIVGILDHQRGEHIMTDLLQAVSARAIELVVIDVTAVEQMDTHTVQRFLNMAQSVRLLGASCTITGIRPTVAQAIVSAGLSLGTVGTMRTVQEALLRHSQSSQK